MKKWENNEEYFKHLDDKKFSMPEWAVVLLVIVLFSLVIVVGIELISARKQLISARKQIQAIETAVRDCKQLNTKHLIIQPVQGCSEANPTALIGYKN